MKALSLTSPDGFTVIQELTHKGIVFHLPPWIPAEEFIAGLDSTDDGEALSSLVGCTLVRWEKAEFDYRDDDNDVPVFEVQFKLPFNSARELVVNRFTPRGIGGRSNLEQEFTILDDGVLIEFLVSEYTDFNDVQAFVLPKDFRENKFPGNNEWVEEIFDELVPNFEPALRKKLYWDGLDEEFTHEGVDYVLLTKIHED